MESEGSTVFKPSLVKNDSFKEMSLAFIPGFIRPASEGFSYEPLTTGSGRHLLPPISLPNPRNSNQPSVKYS